MKPRFIIWTFGLVAVIAISACAPAATPTQASVPTAIAPTEALPQPTAPAATLIAPTETPTLTVEIRPIATSRGPDLEATDPTTVSLASGNLQLVEFFRFT